MVVERFSSVERVSLRTLIGWVDTVKFSNIITIFFKEKSRTKKGTLYFIKVHVPWEVMLFYAEELNFKGPLKVTDYCSLHLS